MNILAQILGSLAIILMFLSYQQKNKKDFLYFQIFANIFFGCQYFLLHAFSALASNIISITRTLLFYKYEKQTKKIHIAYLIIFELMIVALGILTYEGLYSIIPIVIAIVYTYGTWQNNLSKTYKIAVIASILWIYYNFVVGAYAAVIGSVFELTSSIMGVIKLKRCKSEKKKSK